MAIIRWIFLSVALVSLAACTISRGPEDEASFKDSLESSGIMQDADSALLFTQTIFHPGKSGFFSGGKKSQKGYIVLTEDEVKVLKWNRSTERLEPFHSQRYDDISSVRLRGQQPFYRLVLKSASTGKYNAYEVLAYDSPVDLISSELSKESYEIINAKVNGEAIPSKAAAASAATVANQERTIEALEARIDRLEKMQGDTATEKVQGEVQLTPGCDCVCPPPAANQ